MKRIGIIGGGQLGRMLGLAGIPLGKRFTFVDPAGDAGARQVGGMITAPYNDRFAIEKLAEEVDVITYEFENVSVEALQKVDFKLPVYPPANALKITQDRLAEKTFFNSLGIETAPFAQIDSLEALQQAARDMGLPAIVKTRREGYDGKGQYLLREESDLATAWAELGSKPLIFEGFVRFDHECSLIGVRALTGETAFYPLVRNTHENGILRYSQPDPKHLLQAKAEAIMQQVMEKMDYVGVLTIEFFVQGKHLLANEMAPRVHNSGHWTIEGAVTSQFENHIRAISGLPLGSTALTGPSAMINIIGEMPALENLLKHPQVKLHHYDKENRSGRKVGHITLRAKEWGELKETAAPLLAMTSPKL